MLDIKFIKNYPIKILFLFILSYLLSKFSFFIPNKYYLIGYDGGKLYVNMKESHMMIRRKFNIHGYWEKELFKELIKKNMIIIDVGANKGYFTILAANLMKNTGKVFSFEPDPNNVYWIRKSIVKNNYSNIILNKIALSINNDIQFFYPGIKSGWGSLIQNKYMDSKKHPYKVKTKKLDDFLNEFHIKNVDLIKIDVQGADLLVLNGAINTLKNNDNISLIMDIDVESYDEKKEIIDLLLDLNFQIITLGKKRNNVLCVEDLLEKSIYAFKK